VLIPLAAGLLFLIGVVIVVAAWVGARWLLRPPNMSAMEFFPDRFGVPYEKVAFQAADGHALSGWFLPSPTAEDKTLIVCHGWGDNKGEILERTLFLNRRAGFNLFYFDFRGHGESAPSPVTMGKLELRDFAGAVSWLTQHKPRCAAQLGVFGQSMGAAVATLALAEHRGLKAAVLESPFADYHQVGARWAWNYCRAPAFPVINVLMLWARLLSGHRDIDGYSPEARVADYETPKLFIAGELDTLMLPADVRRLYDRARGPRDFWIVPGARHAKCLEAAPAEYESRVTGFLSAYFCPVQGLDSRIGTVQ
jgi:pimeloyl-ACP methyl ester carboxylesterase